MSERKIAISSRAVKPSPETLRRFAGMLHGIDPATSAELLTQAERAELDGPPILERAHLEPLRYARRNDFTARRPPGAFNSAIAPDVGATCEKPCNQGGSPPSSAELSARARGQRSIVEAPPATSADIAEQLARALEDVDGAAGIASQLLEAAERGRQPKAWHRKRGRGCAAPVGSTLEERQAAVLERDELRRRIDEPPAAMVPAGDVKDQDALLDALERGGRLPAGPPRARDGGGVSTSTERARRRRLDAEITPTHRGNRRLARKAAERPERWLRRLPEEWATAVDRAARGVMTAEEGRAARPRTSRAYRRVIATGALLLSLSEPSGKRGWCRVVHGFGREAIVSMLPANEDTGRSLHANTLSNYVRAFTAAGWLECIQPDGAASCSGVERGTTGHAFNQYRVRPPSTVQLPLDASQALARAIVESAADRPPGAEPVIPWPSGNNEGEPSETPLELNTSAEPIPTG